LLSPVVRPVFVECRNFNPLRIESTGNRLDAALWEALASFSIFSIRSGSRKTGYDSERVVDEGQLSWKRD